MTRYFKEESTELITVIEKELESLTGIYGLEVFTKDEEWECVDDEGYAHFNSEGEFEGIVCIFGSNQVNNSYWRDLDEDSKYRFEYDSETILSKDEVIEVLKGQDADKVLIEWNGSNHIVYTFITEHELNINTDEAIFYKTYNVGTDYLYQDYVSKKYYLGHTTRYANDLFEKLEEWEPESEILEEIEEEFMNLNNGVINEY